MKGLNTTINPIAISEDAELVCSRLERLLFTDFGSVLGEFEFGSFIPGLLYEQADIGLAREILREAEILINSAEGRNILLENLYVNFEPYSSEGFENLLLEIGISFRMRSNPTETVEVNFFRVVELK